MATALLKLTDVQLGSSVTATNNFTIYQPATPDGTVRIGNGNSGSATDIMTLTSAGNVGIGTSSPTSVGAGYTVLDLNGTNGSRTYYKANGTNVGLIYGEANFNIWAGASKQMIFYTNASEVMRIDSSGNVGIGTSSPTGRLTVQDATNGDGTIRYGSNSTYYGELKLIYANDEFRIGAYGSLQKMTFYTAGSERMRIDYSGNVGIGTSSPGSKLSVVSTSTAQLQFGYSDSIYGRVGRKSDGNYELSSYENGSAILFGTTTSTGSTTERMRIDPSGNLLFNSGYGSAATAYGCRAWVNFNGTGTVAIRASGNVSSITDNGTGNYTVNYSSALVDANYSVVAACGTITSSSGEVTFINEGSSISSSATPILTGVPGTYGSSAMTLVDRSNVYVSVFR